MTNIPDTEWVLRTRHAISGRDLYVREKDFRTNDNDQVRSTLWLQVRDADGTVLDTGTIDDEYLPTLALPCFNDAGTEFRIEDISTGRLCWLMRLPPVDDRLGWTPVARDAVTGREVYMNMKPRDRARGKDKEIALEVRTPDGTVLVRNNPEQHCSANSGVIATFGKGTFDVGIKHADWDAPSYTLKVPAPTATTGEQDPRPAWTLAETHEATGREIHQGRVSEVVEIRRRCNLLMI